MFDFLVPTVIAGAIPAAVHFSGGSRDETFGSALIYPTYLAAKYLIKRRFSQYLLKDASMDTINLPSVTSHNKRRFMVSNQTFLKPCILDNNAQIDCTASGLQYLV